MSGVAGRYVARLKCDGRPTFFQFNPRRSRTFDASTGMGVQVRVAAA